MQIWPAIDIRAGKCVRLAQGDYSRETIYGANPADMAQRFESDGAKFLHVVDLDGAREGSRVNRNAIANIVSEVNATVQVGGGVRSEETIAEYFELGVQRLVIGTKALTDPDWLEKMTTRYPGQLAVGIDARDGQVATEGWQKTSQTSAFELAKKISSHPIAGIVFTDITKDGMMSGPNFEAMEEMVSTVDVPLLCSGGVTTIEDITRLNGLGLTGCVVGRALYEGRLTLSDALRAAKEKLANT